MITGEVVQREIVVTSPHGFKVGDVVEFIRPDARWWRRLFCFIFRRPCVLRNRAVVHQVNRQSFSVVDD